MRNRNNGSDSVVLQTQVSLKLHISSCQVLDSLQQQQNRNKKQKGSLEVSTDTHTSHISKPGGIVTCVFCYYSPL